ncbi:MAG: hypothetical protein LBP87_05060, partial [Planctomycetaceae bacterium]|nr:hypothetical protein [Planctomycetaceae bacterium]
KPDGVRVESVTFVEEQSSVAVYNLQVSGHPSYYANGVLVHNCHLIPPQATSMYRTLVAKLREGNPDLALVGLTATPFRMDSGNIYGEGKLFDRLSYDIGYKTLMNQGFIVRCIAKDIELMTEDDFRRLRVKIGEYSQDSVDALYNELKVTDIIKDVIRRTEQNKQVLVFAPSVAACYKLKKQLSEFGGAEVITSETPKETRMRLIEDFKNFRFKYLCNVNTLTTGFNVTTIDCVVFIRPTCSPVLYAQTVSRGIRKAVGKESVTLLDYGGNVRRHGTIDDLYIRNYGSKKRKRGSGNHEAVDYEEQEDSDDEVIRRNVFDSITKICPQCKEIVRTHVKVCPDCKFDFAAEEERVRLEEERIRQEEEERVRQEAEQIRLELQLEEQRQEEERIKQEAAEEEKFRRKMEEWESRRLEKEKKAARDIVLCDTTKTFCGKVLECGYKKHISARSGLSSLQLMFRVKHDVTYYVYAKEYREEVEEVAYLWLHFDSNAGSRCLERGREWWAKLTGLDNVFPNNVDEAVEMIDLLLLPVTVSYCVTPAEKGSYRIVIDVSHGGLKQSDVKLGEGNEIDKERVLRRAHILRRQSLFLKRRMKQKMESAEKEYSRILAEAVACYNKSVEQSQQDYEVSVALKKEADDLLSFYGDNIVLNTAIDTNNDVIDTEVVF